MAARNRQSVFSFLILVGLILLLIRSASIYHRGLGPTFGWTARILGDEVVTQVDSGSPADLAGLRGGDRIVALDGFSNLEEPDAKERLLLTYRSMDVGDSYRLTVLRGDQTIEFQIPSQYRGRGDYRGSVLQYHVIGLVYLLFGFALLLLKPYDPLAMTFSAFMMSLSTCYIPAVAARLGFGFGAVVDIIQYCFIFAAPYLFIHFALSFPEELIRGRRRQIALSLLYGLYAVQTVVYLIPKLVDLYSPATYAGSATLPTLATRSFNGFYVMFVAAVLGAFGSLLFHLRFSTKIQHRRKTRLILFGMLIGLPPIIVLNGIARFLGLPMITGAAWAVGLLSLAFPLTFGYAIVKHRVMDVRLILRRGVKHILISRLILAVETVAVVSLLYFLLAPKLEGLSGRIGAGAIVIGAVVSYSLLSLLIAGINTRMMKVLDRMFFREVYSAEAILLDLIQAIPTVNEQKELLKLVAGELMRSLHTERVAFFLPEKSMQIGPGAGANGKAAVVRVNLACWVAYQQGHDVELRFEGFGAVPSSSQWLRKLHRETEPVEIDEDDRSAWLAQLPDDERGLLAEVGASLLVPLREGRQMLGVVSLSGKLSELPYTSDDKRLLRMVAGQIIIALERVWLIREVAHQERLRREMEIATMVQRKLFPDPLADTQGLEVVGVCHPARSVGGDYYDFIRTGPAKMGIAIGDVSGKGISAALIMSSLQASLRSMAATDNRQVSEVVGTVNRLLYRSTDSDKFATFFYAVLDEQERTLTYVNAGHDPPMLLRRLNGLKGNGHGEPDGSGSSSDKVEILRPRCGGMVLGILDENQYEQDTLELQPGDMLIAYTDGITEAVNSAGEEYGENRVLELVSLSVDLSARELQQRILDDVRKFMGETDQRDDITVVVMRVKLALTNNSVGGHPTSVGCVGCSADGLSPTR